MSMMCAVLANKPTISPRRKAGVTTEKAPVRGFFVVGPNYTFDARTFFATPAPVDAPPATQFDEVTYG